MFKDKSPLCLIAVLIISQILACRHADDKPIYPRTAHIDTGAYRQLNKKFGVSLSIAPDYLGGLTPNYPIAFATQLVLDSNGKRLTQDNDWVRGFFVPSARKIIIQTDTGYVIINNRKELTKIFAPISSEHEALAYAALYTTSFAAFNDFFNKKTYDYIGEKPKPSYSLKKGKSYEVHLFLYQAFTCDHPYFSEIMQIEKDGSVKMVSKTRSFTDPEDDGKCVD
jgi:hypothetical protein